MNKDVIYIEPDDDITDIIAALESTKEKIVAIVPPKKSAVLRSMVNIKLIAKTGANEGKNVVLVTTDPAIIKLAAVLKIPVTKDLQSAPTIPKEDEVAEEATEEVIEEEIVEEKEEEPEEESEEDKEVKEVIDEDKKAKAEKAEKKAAAEKAEKEKKAPTNPVLKWITENKKWAAIGGSAFGVLVLFLIWAFVIAPSVKITISIRTDSNNFSELISFTTNQAEEKAEEGVFYLEEIKDEASQKADFEATGEKNVGEKATGEVIAYFYTHNEGNSVSVNAGTAFTTAGMTFYSDKDVTLAWSGKDSECANAGNTSNIAKYGCQVTARIPVTAAQAGSAYNVPMASESGWTTNGRVNVYSDGPINGGTDKKVTIVSKEDVENAKSKITDKNKEGESMTKEMLLSKVGDDKLVIDSSFKQTVSDPESTPKVDEKVKDGIKPSIEVKTVTSIYVIDKTKVEEFIAKKAKLAEDQKIYSFKDPFIENFLAIENGYTGKLKTTYYTGAKVTENDILDLAKGRGLGDVQHDIKSKYNGISNIVIDKSFPWVNSAPGDTNKITVDLNIENKNSKD